MDVGALTSSLRGFDEREKLMIFYERAFGLRICGPFPARRRAQDLPQSSSRTLADSSDPFLKSPKTLRAAHRQPHLDAAQRRYGVVWLKKMMEMGLSGVMVRGSGAAWDLRREQPYECYDKLEYDVSRQKRRLLRPLPRPHGRNAPVPIMKQCLELEWHRKNARDLCRMTTARSRRQAPRSSTRWAAHPSLQVLDRGAKAPAGEVYAAIEARRPNSVFIWSRTAPTGIAATPAPAPRTCRHGSPSPAATCWLTWAAIWAPSISCSVRLIRWMSVRRLAEASRPASRPSPSTRANAACGEASGSRNIRRAASSRRSSRC